MSNRSFCHAVSAWFGTTNDRLRRFVGPIHRVVVQLLPHNRRALWLLTFLALGAAALHVAGYLLFYPVLDHFAKDQLSLDFRLVEFTPTPDVFAAIAVAAVILLAGAIQLRYLIHRMSLEVLRRTAVESAKLGVLMFRRIDADVDGVRAIKRIAGEMAFASGFLMRQVTLGLADVLQLLVFLAIMFWLAPGMTASLAVLTVVALWLYARSVSEVTLAMRVQKDSAQRADRELRSFAGKIESREIDDAGLTGHVEALYREGAVGERLSSRIDVKREMKRGPMAFEFIYPLALVVLPLVAIVGDVWSEIVGLLVVYALLLRQAVSLLQGLAASFQMVCRHHAHLVCFAALIGGELAPDCNFNRPDDDETE